MNDSNSSVSDITGTTNLINDLIQVAPIGSIDNVSEDKLKEMGITPPSQAEALKTIDNKTPIRFHKHVGALFDKHLGEPHMGANGSAKMRVGEGKLLKNLIDAHNRKLKKYQRKNKFEPENIYIFVAKHDKEPIYRNNDEYIVTVHTIGAGVNGAKIVMSKETDNVISEEIMYIQTRIDQKYIKADKIIVIKSMHHIV